MAGTSRTFDCHTAGRNSRRIASKFFLLKYGFDRPRPALVLHGTFVYTTSFPSAHSMMSTVAYLTLGSLLASCFSVLQGKGLSHHHGTAADGACRFDPYLSRCSLANRCAGGLGDPLQLGLAMHSRARLTCVQETTLCSQTFANSRGKNPLLP